MRFEHLIATAYIFMGVLWILFSDKILEEIVDDKEIVRHLQTFKGLLYAVVTGIVFYLFLKNT